MDLGLLNTDIPNKLSCVFEAFTLQIAPVI